jgi:hypothetical protein
MTTVIGKLRGSVFCIERLLFTTQEGIERKGLRPRQMGGRGGGGGGEGWDERALFLTLGRVGYCFIAKQKQTSLLATFFIQTKRTSLSLDIFLLKQNLPVCSQKNCIEKKRSTC